MKIGTRQQSEAEARVPAWVLRSDEFAALIRKSSFAVHVLLVLFAHASREDGSTVWCSQRRIAKLTSSSRRWVGDALKLLVEQGWITRHHRVVDGAQIADLIELHLPGRLEGVRVAWNDRLQGKGTGPILYSRDDDLWQGRTRLYERMARIPLTMLASREWSRLREKALVHHTYLLLLVYAPNNERVGAKRLAAEAQMGLRSLRAALAELADEADRWITIERQVRRDGGDGPASYIVEERLWEPGAATDEDEPEETLDETQPPPADLLRELPGPVRAALQGEHAGIAAQWAALRKHAVYPRRESPDAAARRLCREFHTVMGSEHPVDRAEVDYARLLLRTYGARTWRVVDDAVAAIRRGSYRPDLLTGARTQIAFAAVKAGLKALP